MHMPSHKSRRCAAILAAAFVVSGLSAQRAESSSEAVLPIPQSEALVRLSTANADGKQQGSYQISLDGRSFSAPVTTSYELLLRHGRFDPLSDAPPVAEDLRARPSSRLAIVQYWTQGIEAYRRELRRLGADVLLYLPRNANVVEMSSAVATRVAALSFVRAVVPYHPAYKMEKALRDRVAEDGEGRLRINLLTMRRGEDAQRDVSAWIEAQGGVVEEVSKETYLLSATLDRSSLAALAARDDVQWIDRWSAPEHDMDIAREFHGANYVETTIGALGQGLRVEVMDGGCDEGHPDIQNFAVHGTGNTPSDHGTATSGIVVGSGAGNAAARGVLPNAFLAIADYNYMAGGSRYAHSVELQNSGLSWRCVLQSNSWGNARTFAYTSISQDMDVILFDLQRLSILQSQSNAGNQDSRPQAWAKNIISVGGVRHYNTLSANDDAWNSGGSIGPAADGRIKPDLSSFYDSTLTTDRVGNLGYSSGNYTSTFGGTSGATPIVAGHLGLFYQMWHEGRFGNPHPGATAFDNRPNNTTAKAMLINTARQWQFSGANHDLTRVHQGWGGPDMQAMLDLGNEMLVVDEADVLTELQAKVYSVNVSAGTSALKATMVFRDPPGTTSSSLHRINNLDLKLTSPSGTVYHGNHGLLASMWSTSGGSADTVDTVENVFVQSPEAGAWSVEVRAAEINVDAHVETGSVDADYALVVSGVSTAVTAPDAPTSLTAVAAGASTINLVWVDNASNESGFRIERYSGAGFVEIATVGANVTAYADGGLAGGSTHSYRLRAYNAIAASAYSNAAVATTAVPQAPAAPSSLTAVAGGTSSIRLAWTDNANDEDGFYLERDSGVGFVQIASLGSNVTSFVDGSLASGTSYSYRVTAHNGVGDSPYSNTASATTGTASLPAAPSNLKAKTKGKRLTLTWTDAANDENGFRIYRSTGGAFVLFGTVGANVTSFADSSLSSGGSYSYRLTSFNGVGESGFSNTVSVTVKGKRR